MRVKDEKREGKTNKRQTNTNKVQDKVNEDGRLGPKGCK